MAPTKPKLLIVLGMLGFLIVPLVVSLSGIRVEVAESENRAAAQLPAISEAPLEVETWQAVELWYKDRIPFRDGAIEAEQRLVKLIDNRRSQTIVDAPDVVEGPNGWLFQLSSLQQPCITPEQEQRWVGEIQEARSILSAVDKELVISIAPDRATYAVDQVPDDIDNSCQVQNRNVFARLSDSVGLVDLGEVITSDKHALKTDTHWSPEGALVGAEMIADAIQSGAWIDPSVQEEAWQRLGNLERMAGLHRAEDVRRITFADQGPLEIEQLETSLENHPLLRSSIEGKASRRVLLIHDSTGGYTTGWAAEFIRPHFHRFDNIRVPGDSVDLLAEDPVRESLVNADTVAFLYVQRWMRSRFEPAQLVGPIVLGLQDQLDFEPRPSMGDSSGWSVALESGVAVLEFDGEASEVELMVDGLEIVGRHDVGQSAVLRLTGEGLVRGSGPMPVASQLDP